MPTPPRIAPRCFATAACVAAVLLAPPAARASTPGATDAPPHRKPGDAAVSAPNAAVARSPDAGTARAPEAETTRSPAAAGVPGQQAGLQPLAAPFGRIGDVFSGPVAQHPPDDPVVPLQLPGCSASPSFWLARAVSGVALGGSQLQAWLDAHPGLETRLFGKQKRPVLAQTLQRARNSVGVPGPICPAVDTDGWRLAELRPGKLACGPEQAAPGVFGRALLTQKPGARKPSGPVAALVLVSGAAEGAKDACRPRLSVSFHDAQGRARLRYHADYGGVLSAELLGDRCQMVRFTFDPAKGQFQPSLEPGGHGCARKAAQLPP